MSRGRFIAVEGMEGAGKSTGISCIRDVLAERGIRAITTREPGGTPISEDIRRILLNRENVAMDAMTELMLVFAARRQHLEELIKPALAAGTWVVTDRFNDSTYAYQGAGRGIADSLIQTLERISLGGFGPDFTIVLDLPVDEGIKRACNGGPADRFELENRIFFERVRNSFLERASGNARYRIVDAGQPLDRVKEELTTIVADLTVSANNE